MGGHAERVLDELQQLVKQFEELAKGSLGAAGEQLGDTSERLQAGVRRARERLASLERELGRQFNDSARATDRHVHDHVWTAIGVAAAAAFRIGLLAARRD